MIELKLFIIVILTGITVKNRFLSAHALTPKINQYNIRPDLLNITKRDFVLFPKEAAQNPTFFRNDQLADTAIAFIKFHINDMPKLAAILHTDYFFLAKIIKCHIITANTLFTL